MKRVVVISLGGSIIIPDQVDTKALLKFRDIIKRNSRKYKFVIVCGGGSVARKYISSLREIKMSEYLQSMVGIAVTRLNARFMSYFFGKDPYQGIPHDIKTVERMLQKNGIVFCGGLRYAPDQTSDSTAANIAKHTRGIFINLTNVPGLYTKNPKEHKDAKFISEITWQDFYKRATAIKYKPGQHFVLDQNASRIILKNKITTFILGDDFKHLSNLLSGKKFVGTKIEG